MARLAAAHHDKREEKEFDRRQAILDAALHLFGERGFHGTAVPQIAERAGVATGTIYRYFESKEALVNELFQTHKQAIGMALTENFPFQAPAREQFHVFWRRYAKFATENREAFAFLELHHHAPYLDEKSRATEEAVLLAARGFFEVAQQRGETKDIDPAIAIALVHGAFSSLVKAVWLGYLKLDEPTLEASERAVWDAIRR